MYYNIEGQPTNLFIPMNIDDPYVAIFNDYQPKLCLDKDTLAQLTALYKQTNLLICGEVHGAKENADVFYTLVRHLSTRHIGIECSPSLRPFLESAISGAVDFSLIDPYVFESSPLSIEMTKTVATLAKEGIIDSFTCLDSYYDNEDRQDIEASPQEREAGLAKTILSLDTTQPTICLMGQWHTIPTIAHQMKEEDGKYMPDPDRPHVSALYRIRQERPNIPFVHNLYRSGAIYNAGEVMEIPFEESLPADYTIKKVGEYDFDLIIPEAHGIALPIE